MSEESKVIEIRKGDAAKRILEDKEITEAFETVEREYLDALLLASEKDDLGRFRFAEGIKVVRMVRNHLARAVENSKLSRFELEEMNKRKKFGFL